MHVLQLVATFRRTPLGDAYLKYLSSVYLFVTQPSLHEGALHIARQRIISNRSLLKNAARSGLPQYIQSKPFSSKAWIPPNFRVFRPPKPIILDEELQEDEPDDVAVREEMEIGNLEDDTQEFGMTIMEPVNAKPEKTKETFRSTMIDEPEKTRAKRKRDDSNVQKLGDKVKFFLYIFFRLS